MPDASQGKAPPDTVGAIPVEGEKRSFPGRRRGIFAVLGFGRRKPTEPWLTTT
jgi:hypothetical protein